MKMTNTLRKLAEAQRKKKKCKPMSIIYYCHCFYAARTPILDEIK